MPFEVMSLSPKDKKNGGRPVGGSVGGSFGGIGYYRWYLIYKNSLGFIFH